MAENNFKKQATEKAEQAFKSSREELIQRKKKGTFQEDWSDIDVSRQQIISNVPRSTEEKISGLQIAEKIKGEDYSEKYITGTTPEKAIRAKLLEQTVTPETKQALKETGEWEEIQKKEAKARESMSEQASYGGATYALGIGGEKGRGKITTYIDGERVEEKYITLKDSAVAKTYQGAYDIGTIVQEGDRTTYEAEDAAYSFSKPSGSSTDEKLVYEKGDEGFELTQVGDQPVEEYRQEQRMEVLAEQQQARDTDKLTASEFTAGTGPVTSGTPLPRGGTPAPTEVQKENLPEETIEQLRYGPAATALAATGAMITPLSEEQIQKTMDPTPPEIKTTETDTQKTFYTSKASVIAKREELGEPTRLETVAAPTGEELKETREQDPVVTYGDGKKQILETGDEPAHFGVIPSAGQIQEGAATAVDMVEEAPIPSGLKETGLTGITSLAPVASGTVSTFENIGATIGVADIDRTRTSVGVTMSEDLATWQKPGFVAGAAATQGVMAYGAGTAVGKGIAGYGGAIKDIGAKAASKLPMSGKLIKTGGKAVKFASTKKLMLPSPFDVKVTTGLAAAGGASFEAYEVGRTYQETGDIGAAAARAVEVGAQEVTFASGVMRGMKNPPRVRYKRIKAPDAEDFTYKGLTYETKGKAQPLLGKTPAGYATGTPNIPQETVENLYSPQLTSYDRFRPGGTEAKILRENIPYAGGKTTEETLEQSLTVTRATAGRKSRYLDEIDEDALAKNIEELGERRGFPPKKFREAFEESLTGRKYRVGGSLSQDPQLGKYSYRQPHDIDISISQPGQVQEELYERLEDITPEEVAIQKRAGGITTEGEGHLFDIHDIAEDTGYSPGRPSGLGYGFRTEQTVDIGGYKTLGAGEQVVRKGPHSALKLGLTDEGLTVGPVAHRGKDVPDFLAEAAALSKADEIEDVRQAARLWKQQGYKVPPVEEFSDISEETVEMTASEYMAQQPSRFVYSSYPSRPGVPVAAATGTTTKGKIDTSQTSYTSGYQAPSAITAMPAPSPTPIYEDTGEATAYAPSAVEQQPSPVASPAPTQPSAIESPSPIETTAASPSIGIGSIEPSPISYPSPSGEPSPSPSPSPGYGYPAPSPSPATTPPPGIMDIEAEPQEFDIDVEYKPREPEYKPSVLGILSGETVEEEPETVTGLDIRPPTREQRESSTIDIDKNLIKL